MVSLNTKKLLRDRIARGAAVVILDAQKMFFGIDGGLARLGFDVTNLRKILPNINRLQQIARNYGIPLIHVRTLGGRSLNWDMRNLAPKWIERIGKAKKRAMQGKKEPRGCEFEKIARPKPGELVITKHVFDAFNGTPLLFALKSEEINTIIFSGATTEGCVESTARSAYCNGFAVAIVKDAVASPSMSMHNASLKFFKEHLGIVVDIKTLEAIFREVSRSVVGQ